MLYSHMCMYMCMYLFKYKNISGKYIYIYLEKIGSYIPEQLELTHEKPGLLLIKSSIITRENNLSFHH